MIVVENDDIRVGFELFGEDINSPYDNPLDASLLNDYHIYIFSEKCSELIAIYKKDNTGIYSIEIDGSQSNLIWVVVNREDIKHIQGKVYGEVKTKATAGSPFINNTANAGVTNIELFTVLKSASAISMQ